MKEVFHGNLFYELVLIFHNTSIFRESENMSNQTGRVEILNRQCMGSMPLNLMLSGGLAA